MLSRMPGKLFTEQEIVLLWAATRKGSQILPLAGLGREHSIVSGVIRRPAAGGPAGWHHRSPQSCTYFDLREREEICRGLFAWNSIRTIAKSLHRAPRLSVER